MTKRTGEKWRIVSTDARLLNTYQAPPDQSSNVAILSQFKLSSVERYTSLAMINRRH